MTAMSVVPLQLPNSMEFDAALSVGPSVRGGQAYGTDLSGRTAASAKARHRGAAHLGLTRNLLAPPSAVVHTPGR